MAKKKEKEMDLTDLPGIGPATAKKLAENGYANITKIAVANPKELEELTEMTALAVRKVMSAAQDFCEYGFTSGDIMEKKRQGRFYINSGSTALNSLLGGGFESGSITEAFGEFGSGKTQLAHQIAVNVQEQFPDCVVLWIDTETTFRPERIRQMAKHLKMDDDKVLKNIKVARAYNSDHQTILLEKIEKLITEDKMPIKVIIVDSLMAHFRSEYVGRGTLADRQHKISTHQHLLTKLADVYDIMCYVTNQVMAKPDQFFGDPTVPVGGHIVGHSSMYRLYLRKAKRGRIVKLMDSPHLPDSECVFQVTETGIGD